MHLKGIKLRCDISTVPVQLLSSWKELKPLIRFKPKMEFCNSKQAAKSQRVALPPNRRTFRQTYSITSRLVKQLSSDLAQRVQNAPLEGQKVQCPPVAAMYVAGPNS